MKKFNYVHISLEPHLIISTIIVNQGFVETDLWTLCGNTRAIKCINLVNWFEIFPTDKHKAFDAFCSYLADFYMHQNNHAERYNFYLSNPKIQIYINSDKMETLRKILDPKVAI